MGIVLKAPGFLIWFVCGIWGAFICFGIVQDALGTIVAVFGLFVFPALFSLAPIYAGIGLGDWFPLMLVYGGGIAGMVLFGIGAAIDGESDKASSGSLLGGMQENQPPQRTGWATFVAILFAFAFYLLYRILFTFVIAAYANYDPSFATGIGALVLLTFGTNALGFLSGAAVARKIFPRANAHSMYYGLATFLVVLTAISVLAEMARYDGTWFVALVNVVVTIVTIFVLKLFLASGD